MAQLNDPGLVPRPLSAALVTENTARRVLDSTASTRGRYFDRPPCGDLAVFDRLVRIGVTQWGWELLEELSEIAQLS
jgi:hypothetical protein